MALITSDCCQNQQLQSYFSSKKRTGNIKLARSNGVYSNIYTRFGIPLAEECATHL